MPRVTFLLLAGLIVIGNMSAAAGETWSCPDALQGREDFLDGTMSTWPNYSESHGARVQRQHPKTAFIGAQAKSIEWATNQAAFCQYYSHIGVVANSAVVGAARSEDVPICENAPCPSGPYWRFEYTESSPELDKPDREQMLVCMEDRDGLSYPSVGCTFKVPD